MVEIVIVGTAVASIASALFVLYLARLTRRDLRQMQDIEVRIDDQLHVIHEAMLLWNYGDREEAIILLAENDIFVKECKD